MTLWIGPYPSNDPVTVDHTWVFSGWYNVSVKAKDTYDSESNWSEPHLFNVGAAELEIEINGGFETYILGIHVIIRNKGDVNASNVTSHIVIKGGIFGLINLSIDDGVSLLSPNDELITKVLPLGLGHIEINVTASASNAATVTQTRQGIILLFFVFL